MQISEPETIWAEAKKKRVEEFNQKRAFSFHFHLIKNEKRANELGTTETGANGLRNETRENFEEADKSALVGKRKNLFFVPSIFDHDVFFIKLFSK